jgi:hypothetical protein
LEFAVAGIDDERLDFSTAGTSPIKEARQAIDDGKNKLDEMTRRRLSSVLVTPMFPPFTKPNIKIKFDDGLVLAVSPADADAIRELMQGRLEGQHIMLSRAPDNEHVMVTLEDRK